MSVSPGSVWLDARGATSEAHGERGVRRYVGEHTLAVVESAPELIGSVGLDPNAPPPPFLSPLMGRGILRWHAPRLSPDAPTPGIYHVLSPFEVPLEFQDVWPAWARHHGCRLVTTLYDLIPLIMRDQYLTPEEWGYWGTAWEARLGLMRAAHQVLTISQCTADDAMERLRIPEERITVIDSGVSDQISSLVASRGEAESILRASLRRVRPGFLLYVGGWDPRKNLEGTVRAYSLLPESLRAKHQLVIACRLAPLRRFDLWALGRELGLRRDELILSGYVPDRELAALYRSCDLFIFPSLYEGAGLPILEAMSCDAPVAASNTSSMPELLGDLEATFDPADPADMARVIRDTLETPGRLNALRERSRDRIQLYTWKRVAEKTVEGYERATETSLPQRNGGGRPARKRKRLAVVTPWPPERSDVALHSQRLIANLTDHADVDVVVAGSEEIRADNTGEASFALRSEHEFAWRANFPGYDGCLYVLDGSGNDLHAFEAMMQVPGTVLLHDVRLQNLYRELARRRFSRDPSWLEEKRRAMKALMTKEVQAHAERILVHSQHQAEQLRLDDRGGRAPINVVPYVEENAAPGVGAHYAELFSAP